MAKIGVIAALFNHERYLSIAIESVLEQTFQDWELIIWDDGSMDRSLEIAQKYRKRDSRVKVFQHPDGVNLGQEATRNAAIQNTDSEFISLLDTDDYYYPKKLELLLNAFTEESIGLVYGKTKFLNDQTQQLNDSGIKHEPSGDVLKDLIWDNFICAGSVLFRKKFIDNGMQFDINLKTCGEYPLWVEIASKSKIVHVNEYVSVWRDHGINTGSKYDVLAKEELVRLKKNWIINKKYNLNDDDLSHSLIKSLYDLASIYYDKLELKKCIKICNEILTYKNINLSILMKSQILKTLCMIGKHPNIILSKLKNKIFKMKKHTF